MSRKCVTRISKFARAYLAEHVRSPRQLYDETGYNAQHAAISQADIEAAVSRDLSLIEDWLAFTEDKRWTPVWAFEKHSAKVWIVSVTEGGRGYEVVFRSPVPACALMIRMEMEEFRLRKS